MAFSSNFLIYTNTYCFFPFDSDEHKQRCERFENGHKQRFGKFLIKFLLSLFYPFIVVNQKMDSTTPGGRQRRKRTSDVAELIIQTPAGADSNRRQTRSQTRGTPAPAPPAPTPAKKPALEKPASNGSAKGRRGRPPKSATENEKSVAEEEEEVSKEKPASKDKTESKPESKPETKSEDVKTVEKKESAEKKDSSVNSTLVKDKPAPVAASPVKVVATPIIKKVEEESKPEPKVENSHEEKPKENVVAPTSVVEKEKPSTVTEISNEGDKVDKVTTDVEKKVVNSPPDSLTVNNHEQVKLIFLLQLLAFSLFIYFFILKNQA